MVVWTCNHCPYALAWHDRLAEVASDYGERGVASLPSTQTTPSAIPAIRSTRCASGLAEEDWPFPYLHDETQEAALAWAAQVTPHVYVLDARPA